MTTPNSNTSMSLREMLDFLDNLKTDEQEESIEALKNSGIIDRMGDNFSVGLEVLGKLSDEHFKLFMSFVISAALTNMANRNENAAMSVAKMSILLADDDILHFLEELIIMSIGTAYSESL